MTEMPSYLIQNPSFLEPYKPQKQYPKRRISFISIIFSIFTLYILIFYVFHVSPSSVFNDTRILFFISNTLILIIAADYGAFTDEERHDLYRVYAMAKRSSVYVTVYRENPRRGNERYAMVSAEEINNRAEEATVKDIVCVPSLDEVSEKILGVVSEDTPENVNNEKSEPSDDCRSVRETGVDEKTCDTRNSLKPIPYRRSKWDKARTKHKRREEREKQYDRSESDRSKWMIVHEKSAAEEKIMDKKWENVLEESEEFSKMSNEELNRRAEEFIQRFNKQMKLQALRNRQVVS